MESEFAKTLRLAREKRKWTRLQLYMRVNELSSKHEQIVCLNSIERWEKGEMLPRIEATLALAKALGNPSLLKLRIDAIELKRKGMVV
jgi:transcriptional regulator with XRE-family HTH domain